MSNDTKKELEKGKCSACWGKGFYTQLHGIQGFADFIGDKGFETGSTEHKYPCSRCNGTGNEPVPNKNPMEEIQQKFECKKCHRTSMVVEGKDCFFCHQSSQEEEISEDYLILDLLKSIEGATNEWKTKTLKSFIESRVREARKEFESHMFKDVQYVQNYGDIRVEKERERILKAVKEKGLHLGYKNELLDIINKES